MNVRRDNDENVIYELYKSYKWFMSQEKYD